MTGNIKIYKIDDFEQTAVAGLNFMNEIEKEYFEERAAIMEFDGGLIRGKAERMAYDLVLQRRKRFSKAS